MKKVYTLLGLALAAKATFAQIAFDPRINPVYDAETVLMPKSPLTMQVLFVGGHDMVQTTATYDNPATEVVAKQWHDFIGFTPNTDGGEILGWVSVNHEMVSAHDQIGDGGGMTAFAVKRDEMTDSLVVVEQTLEDGRQGKFFNVDFVNHTGETGMNCGGINSLDGRIWTAEEWWRSGNDRIADRDTSDFTIGTGTENGISSPAGFPGFNGTKIKKYQNYNYMTEIDPRQAVAIRKQYNWGRQAFEGGAVLADNKTVILGVDATPGFLAKFVADEPGDFTKGKTYVYKHDGAQKWLEIDNTDMNKMLNFASEAVSLKATMYNRLEWVAYDENSGMVYLAETGRDNPAGRWRDESEAGAVHAPHTIARATAQGTDPDSADYVDYYGRVLKLDPTKDEVSVHISGGPEFHSTDSVPMNEYPDIHLSNPDGLTTMKIKDKTYLVVQEDLNGTSHGRVPGHISNRACELFLLDLDIEDPEISDLMRITIAAKGAEITGARATPDGKTLMVNSQHPSENNPFPFNNSLTVAIHGFDQLSSSMLEKPAMNGDAFKVFPNPVSRYVFLNKVQDVAIYNLDGQRVKVYRNTDRIDVSNLASGTYFVQNQEGQTQKVIIE